MTPSGDDDVPGLSFAESWVIVQIQNPFVVDLDDRCVDGQIVPHHFAAAFAFGQQDFAVWLRERDNQRSSLARSNPGSGCKSCRHCGDGRLFQPDACTEADFD